MQIFDVIIFFELGTIQQKTVKPTYLCPLARKLAEGKPWERVWKTNGPGLVLLPPVLQSAPVSLRELKNVCCINLYAKYFNVLKNEICALMTNVCRTVKR